jgi:intracellular sulfur oxidation DsrE/DsrF family protein
MGHGDDDLGQRILKTFLQKSALLNKLEAVVLFNGGVKLATKSSPVAAELHQLHESGVDICACGTCVDYYGLRDQMAVDEVSNMDAILQEMNNAEKLITL